MSASLKEELPEFYQSLIACQQGDGKRLVIWLEKKGTMKPSANSRDMWGSSFISFTDQKEKGEEPALPWAPSLKEDKNYYKKVAEQHLNSTEIVSFLKN